MSPSRRVAVTYTAMWYRTATLRLALAAGFLACTGEERGSRTSLRVDTLAPADSTLPLASPPDSSAPPATTPDPGSPAPVPVRFVEGTIHGFLRLTTAAGQQLARGDLLQRVRGDTLESRMTFAFDDGSRFDEQVAFTQDGVFRMLSYRLVQQGPAFATQLDARLDRSGAYWVASRDFGEDDEAEVDIGDVELPADTYNGMPITILKNLSVGTVRRVHLVAFTPDPRLIELELSGAQASPTAFGNTSQGTAHFTLVPKVGGITGFFARLLDKIPPDSHVWIVTDGVPAFVRFEGPLYDGPIWRIDLVGPDLPP